MPQDDKPIFRWGKASEPPSPVKADAPAVQPAGVFRWGGKTAAQESGPPPSPPSPPEPDKRGGSWLTRPLSETLAGTSAGEQYDSLVKKFLPVSIQNEKGGGWVQRFGVELARGGPEVLDFVQSPLGATLVAAHAFPATAPFAAIVDVGMGMEGAFSSLPSIGKAFSTGSPEDAANAVKTLAFSVGMVKGGSKTLLAKAMKFRVEPLESREALRSAVTTQEPGKVALMKVAEKYKSIPAADLAHWAKQPLSEIENAQRKAVARHAEVKKQLLGAAKEEDRKLTTPEKRKLFRLNAQAKMLKDMGEAALPAKMKAVAEAKQDPAFSRKLSEKVYGSAWLREPGKMMNIPFTRLMQVSADIVFDRASFLAKRNLEVNRMIYDLKKSIPVGDREVQKLGYVMQDSATADEVGLTPEARKGLAVLKEFADRQDELLYEAYGKDLPLEHTLVHLSQMWDLEGMDQPGKEHASRTLMNDPFFKKKKIGSYKQGIEELHLKPKFNDVLDIIKLRADFATKAIANRRMASWLRDMGVIINKKEYYDLRPAKLVKEGEQKLNAGGNPYGSSAGRTFQDWRPATDAVALYRAAYSDKMMDPGMTREAVFVHPDYADAVNAVFGKGWDNPAFNALETLRAFGKKTALTFSMFHHWALSEQAQAIYATRKNPISTLSKTFAFNPEFHRGLKSGIWEAIGRDGGAPPVMRVDPKISTDAVEHGLNLKSEDQEHWIYNKIHDLSSSQNRAAKVLGATVKPLATALKGWDRALWDFYHQGMMLDSFEMLKADELRRLGPNASEAKVREVKRAVAEHVNNAFGSVSYEKMLLSPKVRQSLNWLLLAPAWTMSNVRVLTNGYETEAGVRLTNRYVTGAAISWFLTTQAMNYALSGWYTRNDPDGPKPRLTYDNPGLPVTIAGRRLPGLSENSFNIYAGKNDDGSEKYVVLGKGFREPNKWVTDPFNTFWGKASLPIREIVVQSSGHDPGTGYEEIDLKASQADQLAQRAAAGLEAIGVPFVAQHAVKQGMHAAFPEAIPAPQVSSQFASLPTKKGVSFMRAEQAYRDAVNAGDVDMARDILSVAAANGIDPKKIQRTYKQDERKRQRRASQ